MLNARSTNEGAPQDSAPSEAEYPRRTALPEDEGEVVLSYRRIGHLPAFDVFIDGKGPFRFVFDTGSAGSLAIDMALANELGLEVVGETPVGDPSGENVQMWKQARVRRLELGGVTFDDFVADVSPGALPHSLSEARGILGIGLFRDCLVTLDLPFGELRMSKGELPGPNGRDVVAFTMDDGVPTIALEIDSTSVRAHIDSGSGAGFLLPADVVAGLPFASQPRSIGRARTLMNEFEIREVALKGTLRIGGHEYLGAVVQFASVFPVANIGIRVLSQYSLTFDVRNLRARFERTADPSSKGRRRTTDDTIIVPPRRERPNPGEPVVSEKSNPQ